MQPDFRPTPPQPAPEAASSANLEREFAAFSPLPLRPRGILELVDVSVKVYKQYFAVLLGWSVITVIGSLLAGVVGLVVPFGGSFSSSLLTPLMTGVVACCLAAGVRGQRVEFGQCWRFTKPRFWPMVGLYLLAFIIMMMIIMVFCLVCGLLGWLGFLLVRNAPDSLQLAMAIIGGFILLTAGTICGTVVTAWANLVPVVVCMEPDKMNSRALGRAYELIRGQWVRVCTLTTMIGLGILVLYAILWGVAALLVGLPELKGIMNGESIDTSQWVEIIGFVLLNGVLYIISKPIFALIMNLFYLDMRVRNEALDLEWNAHVTAPPMAPLTAPGTYAQLPTGFATTTPLPPMVAHDPNATPPPAYTPTAAYDAASVTASPASFDAPAPQTPAVLEGVVTPTNQSMQPTATPQTQTITCPKCGSLSPASYIFCMKCGTQLREAASGSRW